MIARAQEYAKQTTELAGWPVNVITYRVGSTYYTTVENTDPGAWVVKAEGPTKQKAEAKAISEAETLLAKVRRDSARGEVPAAPARVQVGQPIPDFELEAFHHEQIKSLRLSDYRGQWLLLLFYPADFTFVCPTELEEAAGYYNQFKKVDAEILSVSADTVYVHKAWHDQSPAIRRVQFPMLADPTGKVCRAFGTYLEGEGVSLRASCIIDPDGILRAYEIHDNSIGRSTPELLRKLQAAIFVRAHKGEACPASWQPGDKALKPGLDLVGKI